MEFPIRTSNGGTLLGPGMFIQPTRGGNLRTFERPKRVPFQSLNAAPLPSSLWFVEGWVVMGNTETLIVVPPDGRMIDMQVPAMHPYDEVQTEWPRTELHFVSMFGVVHAVIADTFRHACKAIEEVYE